MSQKKSSNPFTEHYKTISNTELIVILDNPDKYQGEAVEAAKLEFNDRNLSEEQIAEAKEVIIAKKADTERKKEKIESIKKRAIDSGNLLVETLSPIKSTKPSTDKIILSISLVYAILTLYTIISNRRIIPYFFLDILESPFSSLLFFTPILMLISGTFLFWRRKKLGWMLMAILSTWSAVQALLNFLELITSETSGPGFSFFPRPSPESYLTTSIFFGATTFLICKQAIREACGVEKKKMNITIIIVACLSLLFSNVEILAMLHRSFG